jgi:hypothetical protein
VSLSIVPDPAERSAADALSSQIKKLSRLVDRAIDDKYEGDADILAKLVTAMARLIEARTKAEQSIKPAALAALMAGMASVVNAHVTAPDIRSSIRREWHRLSKELAG